MQKNRMSERLYEDIFLIKIPFEDLYTSVFFLTDGEDTAILDSGTCDEDARRHIIPEVARLGLSVKYLLSSHSHSDHMGGLDALKMAYPDATEGKFAPVKDDSVIFSHEDIIFGRFRLLNLKGHAPDAMAVLDVRTNTLLSCDCLQLRGIGKYRNGIADAKAYLSDIQYVRKLEIEHIIASHEYDPFGQFANGKDEVKAYFDECERVCSCLAQHDF